MKPELETTAFPMAPQHPDADETPDRPMGRAGLYSQIFFLVIVLWMVTGFYGTEAFYTFSIIFSSIVLEALPFMLLGTLLGGFVEVFLSREKLISLLPASPKKAIIFSAFLGILLPVCECAIVPVVRKFLQKGMPLGAAVAFLLGGPIVNPLVFSSTFVAYSFSWEIAGLRTLSGVSIAICIGMLIDSCITEDQALVPKPSSGPGCGCHSPDCGHNHSDLSSAGFRQKLGAAFSHGALDFYDIARFLIIGAFIAAALQTIVPRQAILSVLTGEITAIPLMMGLAIVLNLCSEADAFIAASFAPLGIGLAAQMAFMVLGPMLDIKLVIMYTSVFTRKMIVLLVSFVLIFVFTAMVFMEVFT